jgi:hypothetical protein
VQPLTAAGVVEANNGSTSDWPGELTLRISCALKDAADLLNAANGCPTIHWLPEFGCALLPLRPTADEPELRLGEIAVHLIQLDNWTFRLHRYNGARIRASHLRQVQHSDGAICFWWGTDFTGSYTWT